MCVNSPSKLLEEFALKEKHTNNEKIDNNKNIEFLNPAQSENGFYVESGWASIGNKIKVPTKVSKWKVEGNKTELLKCFDGWNEELLSMLSSTTTLYKWGIFERRLPRRLFQDRCILLGDAAHPMVPFLGQGGCMAIEDSYTFALLLNKLDMNIPMAQKIYSKLRILRNNKIAKMSLQQARLNHIENYYLASLRNIIMKKTNVISSRTNYIWEYDAHVQVERELKNYSFNKTTNI